MLVIGGGAAGILAAYRASTLGVHATVLEKTTRLGTKILMSGGGKCNVAHAGPIEELLARFRREEARFLRPACYALPNTRIVELMTSRGLRVYTRPNGRIFPIDQTAKDVVRILAGYLDEARVEVELGRPVQGLRIQGGRVEAVLTEEGELTADAYVLSVGGASYPASGTTGDGYAWAKAAGHRIVTVRAALAPITMKGDEPWPELAGIALRDGVLRARQNGKELDRQRGDLLFTHRGVSGPSVLEISRAVAESAGAGPVELLYDLAPDQSFEQIKAELGAFGDRRTLGAYFSERAPARLAPLLAEAVPAPTETAIGALSKKSKNRVVEVVKGWMIGTVNHAVLEKGEVVAGGVDLSEVDPKTMRSKFVSNLYLCGEILDVAGPVGGYNLQAAFATGWLAGESAARPTG